jgi:hypothetical protein
MRPLVNFIVWIFVGSVSLFIVIRISQLQDSLPQEAMVVNDGVARTAPYVHTLVFGPGGINPAMQRILSSGAGATFVNGRLVVGNALSFVPTSRGHLLVVSETSNSSKVFGRVADGDFIVGDAPFTENRGRGHVYMVGNTCNVVRGYWRLMTCTYLGDYGIVGRAVRIESTLKNVQGYMIANIVTGFDVVLGDDGITYIGNVSADLREANMIPGTTLAGGSYVIEAIHRRLNVSCVRLAATSARKYPILVKYVDTCGSYTNMVPVCNFTSTAEAPLSTYCNGGATSYLQGVVRIRVSGLCDGGDMPTVIGKNTAGTEVFTHDFTEDAPCQQNRYKWVCTTFVGLP